MTAIYGYDFADRQQTLEVQVGADPALAIVTGSSYLPSGPPASVVLGNGASETRTFDGRYVPEAIILEAPTPRRWDYTADGVGNILGIETRIGCSDADLVLANQTVTGIETFTTCAGIEAGPAFSVEAGGSATFTAGTRIALGDGFSVQSGGTFTAGIDPAQSPVVETREYSYQDFQYFLTGGDGPWGSLTWTYDRIGNRLTETRDGVTDTYAYLTNGSGGNTAVLSQITLGVGGTRNYDFGPAGHLELVTAGANEVVFDSDDEGRLESLSRPVAGEAVEVLYDGRSFMQSTVEPATGAVTEPAYSSEGLLHALRRQESPTAPEQQFTYLYFAGRPVAQLELDGSGGETLRFLITDHLGTPVVALDETGNEVWDSGFEPFGRDSEEATPDGALANEVFLRFPGQWEDGRWGAASLGATAFYNVHRWYQPQVDRYTRPDPLDSVSQAIALLVVLQPRNLYAYVQQRPIALADPLGLLANDPTDCVTRWTAAGATLGAGAGAVVGTTVVGGGAGVGCTLVAPGVGTVGCGAAGAAAGGSGGAALGGALGGLAGWVVGTLACQCDDSRPLTRADRRRSTEVDCRKARELCIQKCSDETLPTRTLDGAPFFKCLKDCLESFGC